MERYEDMMEYLTSSLIRCFKETVHSIFLYNPLTDDITQNDNNLHVAVIISHERPYDKISLEAISNVLSCEFHTHLSVLLIVKNQFEQEMHTSPLFQLIQEGKVLYMATPNVKKHSIEDILSRPDGKRAELINDEIIDLATPTRTHQFISNFLSTEINVYIRQKKGNCEIYAAPFSVFLDEEKPVYVEPDISVICAKDKLDEHGCHGAPDWIIEIVSQSSRKQDYFKKLNAYDDAGVRDYWIVDPTKKVVVVYHLEDENMIPVLYGFQDKVKANIYEDFEIDFSTMELTE